MLTPTTLPLIQQALAEAGVDGWLLYDFRGCNPIARSMLQLEGMQSRRVFAWVPREGTPVAISHAIEQAAWVHWPGEWTREVYSSWRSLETAVATLVRGRRAAMEYSPGDAVPYVDRVPAGVLEMVRAAGADVVTSGDLVTLFYARWHADHISSHLRSAEAISVIAHEAMRLAGARAAAGTPMHEHEVMRWILEAFEHGGMETDHGPIVAAGANAANPHYEPSEERPRLIERGELLLVDLFAKEKHGGVWADQTWMACLGEPTARMQEVWRAVRDARDAAIDLVLSAGAGGGLRGGDVDDAAREVIVSRGFGEYFIHRTGHSIDSRDLHGSGPHLDNLETRDERRLLPGVAFSIEPGVYIAGEIGIRSEVNAYLEPGRAVITPTEIQRELLVV